MPHVHPPYPTFDVECFKDTLRIIRGGTVREELPLFAKSFHTLLGAAFGAIIGEPPGPMSAAALGEEFMQECSLDELKQLRVGLESLNEDGPGLAAADEAAIDPATLALIVQLVLALVNKWINKKESA